VVFLTPCFAWGVFFNKGENMQMTLIKNTDITATLAYKIARVVYAETGATSLSGVEALTAMIKNLSEKTGQNFETIITDENIFNSLNKSSPKYERISVPADNRAFQMCVRVASRMLTGGLIDKSFGATKFHHADVMPTWAIARGYIADIDGMLFYL
jgi:hypothetical protein